MAEITRFLQYNYEKLMRNLGSPQEHLSKFRKPGIGSQKPVFGNGFSVSLNVLVIGLSCSVNRQGAVVFWCDISAFILRLISICVVLMFLVHYVSSLTYFRAVASALWAFLSSRHSSALYCFYCIVSVLMNKKYSFIYLFIPIRLNEKNVKSPKFTQSIH